MFTGIIREIGEVKKIGSISQGKTFTISCSRIKEGLAVGDSVSVNGVCLSVTAIGSDLQFDVVKNTLHKTNLKRIKSGEKVNLETAMRIGDTVSGHMVSGHVDGERMVMSNKDSSRGWALDIEVKPEDAKYLIEKGSVAIDGVSLTVAEVRKNRFTVFIIPLTLKDTTLKLKKKGDYVNVEFDIMAKYSEKNKQGQGITEDLLRRTGFM